MRVVHAECGWGVARRGGRAVLVLAILLACAGAGRAADRISSGPGTGYGSAEGRIGAEAARLRGAIVLAQAAPRAGAAAIQGELDALVKAAQSEGEVTIYSSVPETTNIRVGTAFQVKYGIRFQLLRLTTASLSQRYFSEAEAGKIAGDIIITAGGGEPYTTEGIKRGWVESIVQAGLPVMKSGEFPARFIDADSAIIQISPWIIAYNTNLVQAADVPKDWADLLNPKWKGKILVIDPRVGIVNAQFWLLILDKYGESFFTALRAQDMRRYANGAAAVQALVAGEGSIHPPALVNQITGLMAKGAPINQVTPEFTTGTQFHLVLTARGSARHPNAARLLANYIMSPEGNRVFNNEAGVVGVYDTSRLPRQFELPKAGAAAQVPRVAKLLGYD